MVLMSLSSQMLTLQTESVGASAAAHKMLEARQMVDALKGLGPEHK